MVDLEDIYQSRILELAANIPHCRRLADPQASARAHSKLCGSTVIVDLIVDGNQVVSFGQDVKACLLGQAAASVVGREIIGSKISELLGISQTMRAMLKENGALPQGRWSDLAVLEPVKDYKARHASTLLVFDAVDSALSQISSGKNKSSDLVSAEIGQG